MSSETKHKNNEIVINKKIIMLMPFRSEKRAGRTKSRLENIRVKHIIEELIKVYWRPDTKIKINYTVNVALTGTGEVQNVIEKDFEEADLFIALLSEQNVNVIYEIAIVNTLQKNLILVNFRIIRATIS